MATSVVRHKFRDISKRGSAGALACQGPHNGEFRFESRALVKAAQQAVREALLKHKRAGNPVVGTDRKGKVVVVPAKRIDV